ncbi:MAG: hypothetical protein KME35_07160 [Aphanocapsa sp. GSE-SYN-MK-11-07L]|jgi:hypothetical protein|nr:hypothetical protein [Aphanocapsa sp. GSE-SYN-MK-11-07L]
MAKLLGSGQMTWKLEGAIDCALHLRHHPSEPWFPYENFPEYVVADPPEISKGYATFLALLKKGWTTV